MALHDPTSFATSFRSKNKGSSSSSDGGFLADEFTSAEGLMDDFMEKYKELHEEMQGISFRSQKKIKQSMKKSLSDQLKEMTSFSKTVEKIFDRFDGGIFSGIKGFKKAEGLFKSGQISRSQYTKLSMESANQTAAAVGKAVQKVADFVVKQYAQYAKAYEQNLPKVSTNLNLTKSGYSNLMQGTTNGIWNSGLAGTVSSTEAMTAMSQLVQSGITSNLETLSTVKALSSSISTTWSESNILEMARMFGTESGLMEKSLGQEAMLTHTLNDTFGDSQYVMNGMYQSVRKILANATRIADSADAALEIEMTVQKYMAGMYEMGLSEKGAGTIQEGIQELTTKGYTTNRAALLAMNKAGMSMTDFFNSDGSNLAELEDRLMQGYAQAYADAKLIAGGSIGMAGAYANAYQLGEGSDVMNGDKIASGADKTSGVSTNASDFKDYYEFQKKQASDRQTFQSKVEKYLANITGALGGNYLSQAGSGIISGVGGAISGILGTVAGGLVLKTMGGKILGGLGGKGAASMLGGGGGGGLLSKVGGAFTNGKGTGLTKVLGSTGAKVAGGVGGGIAAVADGIGAINNKTYSDNGVANFLGGAVMGNASGDQSFGGYAKAIGGNALKGAAIGTMFGPIGTAIGAGVGALFGGIGNLIAGKKKKKEAEQAASAAASSSSSADSEWLSKIHSSINLQTDKLIAALTNMYIMLDNKLGGGTTVASPKPASEVITR